jgi:deoxyhypusine synthase
VFLGIRKFIDENYLHFNAGELSRCANSLSTFLTDGGRLMLTLAGAMSTAGIGKTLAPAIRAGFIDAICCTGANLEEDYFALIGRSEYETVSDWRAFSPEDDALLASRGLNRVTDVAIPESVIRTSETALLAYLNEAGKLTTSTRASQILLDLAANIVTSETVLTTERVVTTETVITAETVVTPETLMNAETGAAPETLVTTKTITKHANPDQDESRKTNAKSQRSESWLVAAAEMGTAIFCPGFEDSTLGNIIAARISDGTLKSGCISSGLDEMAMLANWYRSDSQPAGFLQVGGGIAGDFAISVVPMLRQDLGEEVPLWAWFAQISESRPSYGGYSGAPPSEKISWEKLAVDTPRFVIESDATIVLPLLLGYLLDL